MNEKLKVEPKAFEGIKKWEAEGKQVYHAVCQNLGCLRGWYTPHKPMSCLSCHCPIPEHAFTPIKSSDLVVEEFVPTKINRDDLSMDIDWKGTILLNIQQYWRPIKFGYLPTGDAFQDMYHQMRYGSVADENDAEHIVESIKDGTYIDENIDMINQVCKSFGFELTQKPPEEETVKAT